MTGQLEAMRIPGQRDSEAGEKGLQKPREVTPLAGAKME
jgi:hypothetical protein